jgi:hypothetical protein
MEKQSAKTSMREGAIKGTPETRNVWAYRPQLMGE